MIVIVNMIVWALRFAGFDRTSVWATLSEREVPKGPGGGLIKPLQNTALSFSPTEQPL